MKLEQVPNLPPGPVAAGTTTDPATVVPSHRQRRERGRAGYAVYDPVGQKIGSAEEVFVNRDGEPVYVRVRIGFLWTRTVLIPVQFVETDEVRKTLALK